MNPLNREQARNLPRVLPKAITDDLPPYLKDPANYDKVRMQILDTLATGCSHSDLMEYAKCAKCTEKMKERRKLLKKLGFKNAKQYMAWQKIHQEIRRRYPLMDWATRKPITQK